MDAQKHRPRRLVALASGLFALFGLGCSALINPDVDRLGTEPGADSGVTLMDSSTPRPDAGARVDAGDVACVEGARRCVGDTLLTCTSGREQPEDCQERGGFCQGDVCRPHACRPGSRECAADGGSVLSCSDRGHEISVLDCGDGRCDPGTLTCAEGACAGLDEIRVNSSETVDLCDERDDHTYERDGGMCRATTRSSVGDRIFVLRLEEDTRLTIELTDVDDEAAIDTIFYVRRVCDDGSTQVACADDVPCATSTAEPRFCIGGLDVRQSRLSASFSAGTYYIVVDGFNYTRDSVTFECGEVELSVRAGPGSTPGG